MPKHFPYRKTREQMLQQPSLTEREKELEPDIHQAVTTEHDPGVFSARLAQWMRQHDRKKNGHGFSIAEVQAGITQLYDRVEQSFASYFDVLGIESAWPRCMTLEEKRKTYQFTAYPVDDQGAPAQFPPHLAVVPESDDVFIGDIFNKLGLVETSGIIERFMPRSPVGEGLRWVVREIDGDVHAAGDEAPRMEHFEEYNRRHRKTGTDIEQGRNIGLLEDWYSDRRFAEQALTGADPTSLERVPRDLLDEFVAAAAEEEERGGNAFWARRLAELDPAELFVQDARGLRAAVGAGPDEDLRNQQPMAEGASWATAAVTLYHLEDGGQLHPVAIVLDYRGSMANSVAIFNRAERALEPEEDARDIPEQERDWPWRFAKTCAQAADWLRHEAGTHLTRAHFVEEAIIVATHRTVPEDHVVFRLLEPHWYKTLSVNAAARRVLVPEVVQELVGLSPERLARFIRHEFATMDYTAHYVPNDLRRRGFPDTREGLAAARYRNCGYAKGALAVWLAIRRYVRAVLCAQYPEGEAGDAAVAADSHLAAWTAEVRGPGGIPSFPEMRSLDALADAVTMSIFVAAPLHTAVNYLQNFYQAFVPSRPPALSAAPPRSLAELRGYGEADLLAALPVGRQRQWMLAVQVPWLLSFKVAADRNLLAFARTQWALHAGADREDRAVREASGALYEDLKAVALEVVEASRAMDRGSVPYTVLDPSSTAVSILI